MEGIKDKLIRIKHYQKYIEIRSKIEKKTFTYSGLKDLDKFAKAVGEIINIIEQYEFPEDFELKEYMNKKQDEFKEILQGVNDIQILYDNCLIDIIDENYLKDI